MVGKPAGLPRRPARLLFLGLRYCAVSSHGFYPFTTSAQADFHCGNKRLATVNPREAHRNDTMFWFDVIEDQVHGAIDAFPTAFVIREWKEHPLRLGCGGGGDVHVTHQCLVVDGDVHPALIAIHQPRFHELDANVIRAWRDGEIRDEVCAVDPVTIKHRIGRAADELASRCDVPVQWHWISPGPGAN